MNEPKITFYKVHDAIPTTIVQAQPRRDWMDQTPNKFAYRCLPLTVANSSGWEIKTPTAFEATWDGGSNTNAIKLNNLEDNNLLNLVAASHFGSGILTFHVGYLIETTPGWGVWVRGMPNYHKKGIFPLDGFVESDWVPFTFTMNWKFTKPGTVRFEKDETYCFITLVNYKELSTIPVNVKSLSENPVLNEEFKKWSKLRDEFNRGLDANNAEIVKKGWQKFYARGQSPGLISAPEHHTTKGITKKIT